MADTFIDVKLLRQQTHEAVEAKRGKSEQVRQAKRAHINELLVEAAKNGVDFILIASDLDPVLRDQLVATGYTIGKHPGGAVRIGW